tara:strand:- start:2082 stop:2471 length:390 start_codon:yes stop_codon:yes gene_type:complete
MADRNAPASFTFEEWRVEFNQLATDVGDIANLPNVGGSSPTDIIEALTQLNSGITLSDGTTTQALQAGNTLTVNGTANEIETTVSATDTLTIGLPNDVTVSGNLTVNGNISGTGVADQGFAIAMSIALS